MKLQWSWKSYGQVWFCHWIGHCKTNEVYGWVEYMVGWHDDWKSLGKK